MQNNSMGAGDPSAPLFIDTMGGEAWGEVELTLQSHHDNGTLLCSILIAPKGRQPAHHWFRVPVDQAEALARKILFEVARFRSETPDAGAVHMLARWGRQGDKSTALCGHSAGFNGSRREFATNMDKVTCPACRDAYDARLVG